jgi:prevent-host-death family protein
MTVTKISSREFNQDIGRAKRAADEGPVIITDRGKPAYVLLRHESWQRLAGRTAPLSEMLAMEGDADFEFQPQRLGRVTRPVDFD